MDNSTLRMEKYRFLFLNYLGEAAKLAELKPALHYVNDLQKIFKTGQKFENKEQIDSQNRTLVEAGIFLFEHYDLDYTKEGLKKATAQFYAELYIAEANEKLLWKQLIQIVEDIVRKKDWNDDEPWLFNNSDKQHALLLDVDNLAANRISYYRKILSNMHEEPLPPYALETVFLNLHDGLKDLIPFA